MSDYKKIKRDRVVLTPGEVVKELREKKGWSQKVLSDIIGMAVSNISNIERGKSRLGEERAMILAAALGVTPDFILFPNGFEREDLKPKLKEIRKRLAKMEGVHAA